MLSEATLSHLNALKDNPELTNREALIEMAKVGLRDHGVDTDSMSDLLLFSMCLLIADNRINPTTPVGMFGKAMFEHFNQTGDIE